MISHLTNFKANSPCQGERPPFMWRGGRFGGWCGEAHYTLMWDTRVHFLWQANHPADPGSKTRPLNASELQRNTQYMLSLSLLPWIISVIHFICLFFFLHQHLAFLLLFYSAASHSTSPTRSRSCASSVLISNIHVLATAVKSSCPSRCYLSITADQSVSCWVTRPWMNPDCTRSLEGAPDFFTFTLKHLRSRPGGARTLFFL